MDAEYNELVLKYNSLLDDYFLLQKKIIATKEQNIKLQQELETKIIATKEQNIKLQQELEKKNISNDKQTKIILSKPQQTFTNKGFEFNFANATSRYKQKYFMMKFDTTFL
jgi:hypothetical protein